MTVQEFYDQLGGSYDDVMGRLRTEERVLKFLPMLLREEAYPQLCQAMAGQNYEEAFRAAHTLKGVALNLGLQRLGAASGALTEDLRSQQGTPHTAALFAQVEACWQEMTTAAAALLG